MHGLLLKIGTNAHGGQRTTVLIAEGTGAMSEPKRDNPVGILGVSSWSEWQVKKNTAPH